MITAKNLSSANIDFSKLPAKFKEDYGDIVEMVPYMDQEPDFKQVINSYVAGLNKELSKAKPKAKAKARNYAVGQYVKNKKTGTVAKVYNVDFDNGKFQLEDIYGNKEQKFYSAIDWAKTAKPRAKANDDGRMPTQKEWNAFLKKAKATLLASSASLDGIKKMAGDFWHSKNISLHAGDDGKNWSVSNANGHLDDVRVVKIKGRYRLEQLPKGVGMSDFSEKKKPTAKKPRQSAATKKKKAAEIAAAKADVQAMQKKAGLGEFAKFNRSQILEQAQAFHKRRRLSAQVVDESGDHKKRLSPTPENLVRWMKEPGKFDLIGIDTFEKNNPTADLKIKKEIFWHRLLKK